MNAARNWGMEFWRWLCALHGGEEGQTLVEYAMLLVLVVIVTVGIVTTIGNTMLDAYYNKILAAFPIVP